MRHVSLLDTRLSREQTHLLLFLLAAILLLSLRRSSSRFRFFSLPLLHLLKLQQALAIRQSLPPLDIRLCLLPHRCQLGHRQDRRNEIFNTSYRLLLRSFRRSRGRWRRTVGFRCCALGPVRRRSRLCGELDVLLRGKMSVVDRLFRIHPLTWAKAYSDEDHRVASEKGGTHTPHTRYPLTAPRP